MILGTSAFIYRKPGTQTYISKDKLEDVEQFEPIRVDVNLVNSADELDLTGVRKWQPQFEKLILNSVMEFLKLVERWKKCLSPNTM
jgi:hypothetical protein